MGPRGGVAGSVDLRQDFTGRGRETDRAEDETAHLLAALPILGRGAALRGEAGVVVGKNVPPAP
eukprot:11170656-Lingulodinium_polyedra.AAC.1